MIGTLNYSNLIILPLILLVLINKCNSLYFTIDSKLRCFDIEEPKDTPLMILYDILDAENHNVNDLATLSLHYGNSGDINLQIMNHTIFNNNGHISYLTDNDGNYCLCIKNDNNNHNIFRIKLSILYGYDKYYYKNIIKKNYYSDIHASIHYLNDQMNLILNEADFQKHKEVLYHDSAENTGNASLIWPIVQVGILLITGVIHVNHLKYFFKSQKLM